MPDYSHLPPDKRAEAEAMFARMMAALPYERTTISGAASFAERERLATLGRGVPVIVGNDEQLERLAEQYSISDPAVFGTSFGPAVRSPTAILQAAESIAFPDDLSKWEGAYLPEELSGEVGPWPGNIQQPAPDDPLILSQDYVSGGLYETLHVLFIPAEHGWEVPAFLRWGGWNACPPPEYHVAALRQWHRRFGAQILAVGADTIELQVARPPESREEALAVASDIYGYCPDNVDQGAGTIANLAASMVMSHRWSFWWD